MKLSLITSGLLDPKRLDSWVPEKRRAIRKAVEAGMKTAGKEIAQSAQSRMQSVFKVRKAGFVVSCSLPECAPRWLWCSEAWHSRVPTR